MLISQKHCFKTYKKDAVEVQQRIGIFFNILYLYTPSSPLCHSFNKYELGLLYRTAILQHNNSVQENKSLFFSSYNNLWQKKLSTKPSGLA